MQKKWIIAGLSMLMAALLSSYIYKKKSLLIVFIGDSITYGAGLAAPETEAPPAIAVASLRKQEGIGPVDFSNQGVSGFTTVDFLPSTGTQFSSVLKAAAALVKKQEALLLFSIMLGTNDSAIDGPNGSPVSPAAYRKNLRAIIDRLLQEYPAAEIVINRPVWYSPNTYNGARYLQEGLDRLQSYFPEIDGLAAEYAVTRPGHVFAGDKRAFDYFRKHYKTDFQVEQGHQGKFYLHPNAAGAAALGEFWAQEIARYTK